MCKAICLENLPRIKVMEHVGAGNVLSVKFTHSDLSFSYLLSLKEADPEEIWQKTKHMTPISLTFFIFNI